VHPQALANPTNLINCAYLVFFWYYLGLQCIIFSYAPNFPKQPSRMCQPSCHGDIKDGNRKPMIDCLLLTLLYNVKTLNSYPPAIRIILYVLLKSSKCSVCEHGFFGFILNICLYYELLPKYYVFCTHDASVGRYNCSALITGFVYENHSPFRLT